MPRNGGVSSIRIWSLSPETGDGNGIPVPVSEGENSVSRFLERASIDLRCELGRRLRSRPRFSTRLLLRLLELLGADLGRHTVAVLSGGGNSTKKRMLNSDKRAPLVCKRTSVDAGSENRQREIGCREPTTHSHRYRRALLHRHHRHVPGCGAWRVTNRWRNLRAKWV
jgi:hypothetical protein